MKKQLIIDYDEYLNIINSNEILKKLLAKIYFSRSIDKDIVEEIKYQNNIFNWWV